MDDLEKIIAAVATSVFFFALIVFVVRLAGKRITSNMNNFDWIVTVAIGSLMSSGILLESVPVSAATASIVTLAGMQWLAAWASVRWTWAAELLKPRPRLLLHKGKPLSDALKSERISAQELAMHMRHAGYTTPEEANWVILEANGEVTVIPRQEVGLEEAVLLKNVRT